MAHSLFHQGTRYFPLEGVVRGIVSAAAESKLFSISMTISEALLQEFIPEKSTRCAKVSQSASWYFQDGELVEGERFVKICICCGKWSLVYDCPSIDQFVLKVKDGLHIVRSIAENCPE